MGIKNVELTIEEKELYEIFKCYKKNDHIVDHYRETANAAVGLLNSLLERKAISEIRLKYFTDKDYVETGKKSHEQIFIDNNCRGNNIIRSSSFWPYLDYFIIGPKLPDYVVNSFCERVRPENFPEFEETSEFIDLARKLTRSAQLDPRNACEEFYKLAIECGIHPEMARMIRSKIRQIKK